MSSLPVSVIIPSYKPGHYLWECLDSLVGQSFSRQCFEVIIVLNGCKDPYESQIRDYINSHTEIRIHLIQTDQSGVSNARNLGIDASCGEYLAFIDDDDFVSPSYLEELYHAAGRDVIALCKPEAFIDGSTEVIKGYRISKEYDRCASSGVVPFNIPRKFFSGPCMKLIHREVIGNRRFDRRFRNGEDSLFMFCISDRMKWCRFTSANAVYYRRFRRGSAATSKRSFFVKLENATRLIGQYSKLYIMHFPHYNTAFFVTRVLGAIRGVF